MRSLSVLLLLAGLCAAAPTEWLVLAPADKRGRQPFNPDAVFARYLVQRNAPPPVAGENVTGSNGKTVAWTLQRADEKGWVQGRISYAYAAHESDAERVVLARVPGGATLWVNGDAFVGDVYRSGTSAMPILLRKGINHIFVRGVRGRFRLLFDEPAHEGLVISERDVTRPDMVVGEIVDTRMAVVVVNTSREPLPDLKTKYGGFERIFHGGIAPLGMRKVWVGLSGPAPIERGKQGERAFEIAVNDRTKTFTLKARAADRPRRRTFLSFLDASLQQYSELPATGTVDAASIVLSLHGAGVDALNQASAYAAKKDFWIVAPTNRRPFGFDWQDWGRVDAYEVLSQVLLRTEIPSHRVYLTGHSMGGHGAWHLAAHDPDGFAAVAPSAGWCSFDSYGGRPATSQQEPWRGADGASNTLDFVSNLIQTPSYILHGEKDDNVPAREGRAMEKTLRKAGGTVAAHYQPNVKHWWNVSPEGGADCVDWPAMFSFFRKHKRGPEPGAVEFRAVDPATDAQHYWIRLVQAERSGRPVGVRARREGGGVVRIDTENLRSFATTLSGAARTYVIDDQVVRAPANATFLRTALGWSAGVPRRGEKSAARCGPFKRAFANRFVFVYGEGDGEALARARYDQQVWWYRGNGDAAVITDEQFLAGNYADRNVILYGNRSTNRAFTAVLPKSCPLDVQQGRLRLGKREWEGNNLACLLVYPRKGEPHSLVGVFGATGVTGLRLGYSLLTYVAGVGYPDYVVYDQTVLEKGADGVAAAGWFNRRWRLARE